MDYPFVSERHASSYGHWVGCTEASSLMAAHNADPSIVVTWEQVLKLREHGEHGSGGGTVPSQMDAELLAVFGHRGVKPDSMAGLRASLDAGAVAVIDTDFSKLTPGLQRWDPAFGKHAGAWHAMAFGPGAAAVPGAPAGTYRLRDPLGPLPTPGSYTGQWVAWDDVAPAILLPVSVYVRVFSLLAWVTAPAPPPGSGSGSGSGSGPVQPPTAPLPPARVPLTYKVAHGDSLARIASHFGVHWQDIYAANRATIGPNPNLIRTGQVLIIPGRYK
jgi:LysM repeat protein